MATLQGLDRGLRALAVISSSADGLTVAELATRIGVDRAIAYRIVETLELHTLVTRGPGKRVRVGAGAVVLAAQFHPQLLRTAAPILQDLADATGASAFLTVEHGPGEGVPVLGAEPTGDHGPVRVGYRIGMRHPLTKGANGIAILALRPPAPDDPEVVRRVRDSGYSSTSGQLQDGASGVAAGFELPGPLGASVGVVAVGELDDGKVAARVKHAATKLASLGIA